MFVLQSRIKADPVPIVALDEVASWFFLLQFLQTDKRVLQIVTELWWFASVAVLKFRLSEVPSALALKRFVGDCDKWSVEIKLPGQWVFGWVKMGEGASAVLLSIFCAERFVTCGVHINLAPAISGGLLSVEPFCEKRQTACFVRNAPEGFSHATVLLWQ